MKTLALAAVAVALIAAPAFAAEETTPNATNNQAPASATALNPAEHTFKVGQHVTSGYLSNKYAVKDPAAQGLAKPDLDSRWIVVENNAYLINTRSDTVISATGVKADK